MNFAIPFCHQLNQSAMTAFCWKAVAVDRSRRKKGMTGRIWQKKGLESARVPSNFLRLLLHDANDFASTCGSVEYTSGPPIYVVTCAMSTWMRWETLGPVVLPD